MHTQIKNHHKYLHKMHGMIVDTLKKELRCFKICDSEDLILYFETDKESKKVDNTSIDKKFKQNFFQKMVDVNKSLKSTVDTNAGNSKENALKFKVLKEKIKTKIEAINNNKIQKKKKKHGQIQYLLRRVFSKHSQEKETRLKERKHFNARTLGGGILINIQRFVDSKQKKSTAPQPTKQTDNRDNSVEDTNFDQLLSLYWGVNRWYLKRKFKFVTLIKFVAIILCVIASPIIIIFQTCIFVLYDEKCWDDKTKNFNNIIGPGDQFLTFVLSHISVKICYGLHYYDILYALPVFSSNCKHPDPQFRSEITTISRTIHTKETKNILIKLCHVYESSSKEKYLRVLIASICMVLTSMSFYNMTFWYNSYEFYHDRHSISQIELVSGPYFMTCASIMIACWYCYDVIVHPSTKSLHGKMEAASMRLTYIDTSVRGGDIITTNMAMFLCNFNYYHRLTTAKTNYFERIYTILGTFFGIIMAFVPGLVRISLEKSESESENIQSRFFSSNCQVAIVFGLILNCSFAALSQYLFNISIYASVKDYLKLMRQITVIVELPDNEHIDEFSKTKSEKIQRPKEIQSNQLRNQSQKDLLRSPQSRANSVYEYPRDRQNKQEKDQENTKEKEQQNRNRSLSAPVKRSTSKPNTPSESKENKDTNDNDEAHEAVDASHARSPSCSVIKKYLSDDDNQNDTEAEIDYYTENENENQSENEKENEQENEASLSGGVAMTNSRTNLKRHVWFSETNTQDLHDNINAYADTTDESQDGNYSDSKREEEAQYSINISNRNNNGSGDNVDNENNTHVSGNGFEFLSFDDPENLASWMEIRDHALLQGKKTFGDLELVVLSLGFFMIVLALFICRDILIDNDLSGETKVGRIFLFIVVILWIYQVVTLGFEFDSLQDRQIYAVDNQFRCLAFEAVMYSKPQSGGDNDSYQSRVLRGPPSWVSLQCGTWDRFQTMMQNPDTDDVAIDSDTFAVLATRFDQHLKNMKFCKDQIVQRPLHPKIFNISITGALFSAVIASAVSPFVLFIFKNTSQ